MTDLQLTTRQRYDRAYRRFRQYGDTWEFIHMFGTSNTIIQAAEYAYEAKDFVVTGWRTRMRYSRFLNRKADITGELPF